MFFVCFPEAILTNLMNLPPPPPPGTICRPDIMFNLTSPLGHDPFYAPFEAQKKTEDMFPV